MKNKEIEKAERTIAPAWSANETKDGYEIEFRIPGCGKEDVSLDVENRTLVLNAKNTFLGPDGLKCIQNEFPYCGYAISLELPEHADAETVSGSVSKGVLKVVVSKKAEVKPRRINVR